MDPFMEVCLLVNSYQVSLPIPEPDDIFVDQQSLEDFLSVEGRTTRRQKSPRATTEGFRLENMRVLGISLTEIKRKISKIIRKWRKLS